MHAAVITVGVAGLFAACSADERTVAPSAVTGPVSLALEGASMSPFKFTALTSSAQCTSGGDADKPLVLPAGYSQTVLAAEPQFGDNIDQNTQNETGPSAGRYLYRAHEVGSNGSLSVTDLQTGLTRTMAQRADWEAVDPAVWTPWGTVLIGEETNAAAQRDPAFPQAVAGLVYEVFPSKANMMVADSVVARPALGAKSHEGIRFDANGNLYGVGEKFPGYIYKFTPDKRGDLSSGQLYALKITQSDGDRTGEAEWVALDRTAVQIDANAAGDAVAATGYNRPEDLEISRPTATSPVGRVLYAAITSEHRVLAIDLRDLGTTARVSDYVSRGVNTTDAFNMPDNLALDVGGNLYIAEDPGGSFSGGKREGDDIWVATPGAGGSAAAGSVVRFASINDCDAEPTGIYFDINSSQLFVNIQHRGGDRIDKAVAIAGTGAEAGNTPPSINALRLDPATGPFSVSSKACGGRYTACVRFSITDADGPTDGPFKTVVAWGDGTEWSPNSVPAGASLLAPHNYTTPGSYPVRVTATDARGASSMQSLTLRIDP